MPVALADIFHPTPLDGVGSILENGLNLFSNSLNQLIQKGRDAMNNRVTQEGAYLTERGRLDQLEQRKAEDAVAQANNIRDFGEKVFEDRRDFAHTDFRDVRNFNYKKEQDARDFALESLKVGSAVAVNQENADTNKAKAAAAAAKATSGVNNPDYLNKRAADIINTTKPLSLGDLFSGTANVDTTTPQNLNDLGKELSGIGIRLGNPDLVTKGSQLRNTAEQRLAVQKAQSAKKPKVPLTDDEQIASLRQIIAASDATMNDPNSVSDPTNSALYRKQLALTKLNDLLKKKAGQVDTSAPAGSAPTTSVEDLVKKYLPSKK